MHSLLLPLLNSKGKREEAAAVYLVTKIKEEQAPNGENLPPKRILHPNHKCRSLNLLQLCMPRSQMMVNSSSPSETN
jgi:hypothetical protein